MRIPHERKESCLEIGINYGFFGRGKENVLPNLVCRVSEQFNWLCGSNSCCQEGSGRLREFISDSKHQESGIQENSGEI